MNRHALFVVLTAVVMAGCASNAQQTAPVPSPQRTPTIVSAPEPVDSKASARAHTQLAGGYYEVGNLAVALEEARVAIATDANYAPAHNIMGLVQMALREPARAEESFQRALRIDGRDPDVNHNYGWFLCQNGRERESVKFFETAIGNPLYPTPAKSHSAAANCLLKVGEIQQAAGHVSVALNLFPPYIPTLISAARLELARGNVTGAREHLSRYLAMTEPSAEALLVAIQVERRRGDRVAEDSFATQLRRRYPASPEFQEYLRGRAD